MALGFNGLACKVEVKEKKSFGTLLTATTSQPLLPFAPLPNYNPARVHDHIADLCHSEPWMPGPAQLNRSANYSAYELLPLFSCVFPNALAPTCSLSACRGR
jgi:hypothetical protein